jgi:hypothetical protein
VADVRDLRNEIARLGVLSEHREPEWEAEEVREVTRNLTHGLIEACRRVGPPGPRGEITESLDRLAQLAVSAVNERDYHEWIDQFRHVLRQLTGHGGDEIVSRLLEETYYLAGIGPECWNCGIRWDRFGWRMWWYPRRLNEPSAWLLRCPRCGVAIHPAYRWAIGRRRVGVIFDRFRDYYEKCHRRVSALTDLREDLGRSPAVAGALAELEATRRRLETQLSLFQNILDGLDRLLHTGLRGTDLHRLDHQLVELLESLENE